MQLYGTPLSEKPNPDLQKLVKRGMLYIRILGIWYSLLSKNVIL